MRDLHEHDATCVVLDHPMLQEAVAWMLYIAALEAQRKAKYRKLSNDRQWKRGVADLRTALGELGMTL